MERLTRKDAYGNVHHPWEFNGVNGSYDIWDEDLLAQQIERLAAYEDFMERWRLGNIGAFFLIVGGVLLVAAVLGLALWLVGCIWIDASNKWRRILRAESLIYEYRKNRDKFLLWKEEQT